MIGIVTKTITVQQLYDCALKHNMLGADYKIILDIIERETVLNNTVNPVKDVSTIDFSKLVEYTVEDLLALLSI